MYNAEKNNINWLDLIDKNEYFDSIRTLPLSQIFYISSINPENFNDIAYNNWKNIILQLFEKDTLSMAKN